MIKSLKAEDRTLELWWKASTKGTSHLEEQRSFTPTVIGAGEVRIAGQVPPLMQLAALKIWDHGQELPTHANCSFKTCQTLPSLLLLPL